MTAPASDQPARALDSKTIALTVLAEEIDALLGQTGAVLPVSHLDTGTASKPSPSSSSSFPSSTSYAFFA